MLHLLPNREIPQDFLASTTNNIHPNITTNRLNPRPLSTLVIPRATHNLLSLTAHLLQTPRAHHFQQGSHATNIDFPSSLLRQLDRVRELFEKGLARLDQLAHLADFGADHLVLEQRLAEGLAGDGVVERVFGADAGEPDAVGRQAQTFGVKV